MAQIPGYNKTTICPFNQTHIISVERIPFHLVKCARNYPDVSLKMCPFNSCHLLKETELETHVLQCEDRMNFDLFKYNISSGDPVRKVEPTAPPPQRLDSGDNWDNDKEQQTYNPQTYVESANVIRTLNIATRSEKKAFREAERLRLLNFKENKN